MPDKKQDNKGQRVTPDTITVLVGIQPSTPLSPPSMAELLQSVKARLAEAALTHPVDAKSKERLATGFKSKVKSTKQDDLKLKAFLEKMPAGFELSTPVSVSGKKLSDKNRQDIATKFVKHMAETAPELLRSYGISDNGIAAMKKGRMPEGRNSTSDHKFTR